MLYSSDAKGNQQYRISEPVIGFISDKKLELYVSYNMYIPVHFAGRTVATARIPIRIMSELVSKK